jgi:hypothetical protein
MGINKAQFIANNSLVSNSCWIDMKVQIRRYIFDFLLSFYNRYFEVLIKMEIYL